MFRSFKSVIFSLLLVVAFTSCEKEMSTETPIDDSAGTQSGSAEFTMAGQPLPCTTPLISGDYLVNTALNPSNTVTINVDVTTIGDYTISTGLINGIKFVATGMFAATGPQTITLFGTGTPLAPITGTYVPGREGCSFSITPLTAVVAPVGPIFYDATIDGAHYRQEADGVIYGSSYTVEGTVDDKYLGSIIEPIPPVGSNPTEFHLIKGVLHSYSTAANIVFKAFFSAGSVVYGSDPVDGVEIQWKDEAGNLWSTALGTADQSASAFNITDVQDEPTTGTYLVRVTGNYHCTLYDGNGNSKPVTGGTFVMVFGKG